MDDIKDLDNASQFIYMKHYLKRGYSPCFIPPMTLGISNINNYCKTWSGIAYFDLTTKGEKFRFKFSNELTDFFFANTFDFNFGFYEVPNKYSRSLDVCFFINNDNIYIIKKA
ncbi:hypothetical protein [Flavobacterium ustbae]|uniref:hypothetical protein n=1 Tax=Flavobacterium ustbae TaxID=2488790 RepID=UPI000F7B1079|nr:hypothetical protein [Flavobacterium ustbae]